jgi:hypothetical protein
LRIVGGDEFSLREFLTYYAVGISFRGGETTIYIGQLPTEQLAVQLPIPANARIVGSIVRENIENDVLLSVDATAQDIMSAYDQLATTAGWRFVEEMPMMPTGFVDQQRIALRRYCNEAAKVVLTVSVGNIGAATSVRLSVNRQARPCAPMMRPHHDLIQVIPTLKMPPSAKSLTQYSNSTSSGHNGAGDFSLSASVTTQSPVSEIVNSYHDQLIALGWQKLSGTINDKSALSSWQFSHDNNLWTAYFVITANPLVDGEYMMWLNGYGQV